MTALIVAHIGQGVISMHHVNGKKSSDDNARRLFSRHEHCHNTADAFLKRRKNDPFRTMNNTWRTTVVQF